MTGTDLIRPPEASSMLPGIGDLENDDEDAAGYAAMMSELPTIVQMSGLLDGDFDELDEIQNLLAPPVSDDDAEECSDGEPAGSLNAFVAAQAAQDSYIQAMVPNPIPTGEGLSGLEVSAAAAAIDEDLGFPSNSLMTSSAIQQDTGYVDSNVDDDVEDIACMRTFTSSRAPTKRVHNQMNASVVSPGASKLKFGQPFTKKLKRGAAVGISATQTPAAIRTSLNGASAPNPLLFGRPITLPADPKIGHNPAAPKPKALKASLKPRPPQKVKANKGSMKMRNNVPAIRTPREVVPPAILNSRKFVTPETSLTYSAPPSLVAKLKDSSVRPTLCKLIVMGKIENVSGSNESAIAPVPSPPISVTKTITPAISATASKKRSGTSDKKKRVTSSSSSKTAIKKKTNQSKTKKISSKDRVPTAVQDVDASSVRTATQGKELSAPSSLSLSNPSEIPVGEALMVANPLANVAPTAPAKLTSQVPPKPEMVSRSDNAAAAVVAPPLPAVVSSNSSAASFSSDDQIMDETTANSDVPKSKSAKSPRNTKPMTKEERAQACRNRNRQHARNTRLRKKAYVEELKASLTKLVDERDRAEAARKEESARKENQRLARKRVLQEFLKYRGENQGDSSKWDLLFQDSETVQVTLPITKFQSMVDTASPKALDHQKLVGCHEIMADANYLASFLQSLGSTGTVPEESPVYLEFRCDDSMYLFDGDASLLYWTATTRGAVSRGAASEISFHGSIKGVFDTATDKLASVTLIFDTGAIQAQLASL